MGNGDNSNSNSSMYLASGAAVIVNPFLFALLSCSSWFSDGIVIKVRDTKTSAEKPLANAWVYWKKGATITTLHTDWEGILYTLDKGKSDRTLPWDYNTDFDLQKVGEDVEILFSRGAMPNPEAELTANPSAFHKIKSAKVMTVPDFTLKLTKPKELSVWPLFWELAADNSERHHQNFDPAGSPDYLTAGLVQKTNLWNGNTPAVAENAASAAAPDTVTVGTNTIRIRPRERGLAIEGEIAKGATGVKVKIYNNSSKNLVKLRAGIESTAQKVDWVNAQMMAVPSSGSDTRAFKASVFFENAADTFGPVQVFVISEGLTVPIMEASLVYLTGLQIALVDDYVANANGQQRGPIRRESDEVNIVDFVVSPQGTSTLLRNQSRLRRMVKYQFANAQRPLNPALPQNANTNPAVIKPQLPMWMAELHMVGMNDKKLGDFISYRYFQEKQRNLGKDPAYPATFKLDLAWRMKLYWDGPDENSAAFNVSNSQIHYSYSHELGGAAQKVRLFFRDGGKLTDAKKKDIALDAAGAVPNAFQEQPALPQFPVSNRRQPKVTLQGQTRHWGRHVAGVQKDAMVIEFQPRLIDAATGGELVAGGNGLLECRVNIDLEVADPGLVPTSAAAAAGGGLGPQPAADPHARLPTFRIVGANPDRASVLALVEALVDEYYNAHNTVARVLLLSQACWRTTARMIFDHEANLSQFDTRPSHRSANDSNTCYYGNEMDMPIFGWPHGYGIGQIDNFVDNGATRGVNTGEVWSFVENLRTAVRIIMEVKAQEAYNLVDDHLPNPVDRRTRAVYQREIVRRYNGGREFRWNGNDWEISPSQFLQGTARLAYPNQVLGTNVAYSVVQNNVTVYPWPVAFAQVDYGPDT